jgi:hypothetical protein
VNLVKVAKVLDAMAEYIEETERKHASAQSAARKSRLDKIATTHLQAHGEELSDEVRQKLSSTDEATLDVVENLLSKQAGVIAPLGAGAEPDNDTQPHNIKEAVDAASQRFIDWCNS